MADQPSFLKGPAQLEAHLRGNGISTAGFGIGTAKTLQSLLHELQDRACFLTEQAAPTPGSHLVSKLVRVVEPVFICLRYRNQILVQESQKLPDGRLRARRMLLAEKKEPRDGGGLPAIVVRMMHELLNIKQKLLEQEGVLNIRNDTYQFEVEHIDSPSYPGLPSIYRTHYVQVDILEPAGAEVFKSCGLPNGSAFSTSVKGKLGTTTFFWKWYDSVQALAEKTVKFPPGVSLKNAVRADSKLHSGSRECEPGVRRLTKEDLPDDDALVSFLNQAGIDPKRYGVEKAKPLASLRKEVMGGESCLEWNSDTKMLCRIVEPLFVQFRWKRRVLVEVEQTFKDGRKRQRNMLLAEKRSPGDDNVADAAIRGLKEELNLPASFPPMNECVRFMQEAYCCITEKLESASYPGLPCTYLTHYCSLQLLEEGVAHFDKLGMLQDSFETEETDKVNKWRWVPIDEARSSKVKGFPDLKTMEAGDGTSTWMQCRYLPKDIASLRVLLEVGGVSVDAWGDYIEPSLTSVAKELATGFAALEQDTASGKIRRVVRSHTVQLMIDGEDEKAEGHDIIQNIPGSSDNLTDSDPGLAKLGKARSMVHFNADRGIFELEHVDITSYPGLPCCHQTRRLQFTQRGETEVALEPKSLRDAPSKDAVPIEQGQGTHLPTLLDGAQEAQKHSPNDNIGHSAARSQSPDVAAASYCCIGLLGRQPGHK